MSLEEQQSEKLMPMSKANQDRGKSDEVDKKIEPYGFCCFKPSCLQFLNTIRWYVLFHCIFSFCEGFIVNGVINIIVVTLEKRYELSSKESGMIASANDFGAAVLLMIVGYLGTYANKPRLMGAGMFLMSIGCLVFALPQFIGEKYTYTISSAAENSTDNVCVSPNSSTAICSVQSSEQNYKSYYSMLLLGNVHHFLLVVCGDYFIRVSILKGSCLVIVYKKLVRRKVVIDEQ